MHVPSDATAPLLPPPAAATDGVPLETGLSDGDTASAAAGYHADAGTSAAVASTSTGSGYEPTRAGSRRRGSLQTAASRPSDQGAADRDIGAHAAGHSRPAAAKLSTCYKLAFAVGDTLGY